MVNVIGTQLLRKRGMAALPLGIWLVHGVSPTIILLVVAVSRVLVKCEFVILLVERGRAGARD